MERSIFDATKLQVGLLERKNWTTWKYKITIALRGLCVLDAVQGAAPDKAVASEAELLKFQKADSTALLVISTNLSDEVLQKVVRFSTAKDVWCELHRIYEGVSEDRVYDLCLKLFEYKKQPGHDIASHLSAIQNIWFDLGQQMKTSESKGTELPEIFLKCKILDSLPNEYFAFKSSWLMMAKSEKTIDNLTSQLCSYERNISKRNGEDVEALNIQKAGVTEKKPDTCFYCGKIGHRVRQCEKWIMDGKPPKSMASSSKQQDVNMNLMSFIGTLEDHNSWFVDNGATHHVTNQSGFYEDFQYFDGSQTVTTANGEVIQAVGKGTIKVRANLDSQDQIITLNDVWYVPSIKRNLFSVLAAQDLLSNSIFASYATSCKISVNGKTMLTGVRQKQGGLYKLKLQNIKPNKSIEISSVDGADLLQLYHERLAHQNKIHVMKVIERELGIKLKQDNNELCEGCIYGKAHRLKFGTRPRATKVGELVHADVCGPFMHSISNNRYFVLFKDDFSKYRHVYFMKCKSEVNEHLKSMIKETKAMGNNIKELLSDNGGEFSNEEVKQTLDEHGIKQRLTMPYTPEQNGCVERENRTVVEAMRAIMHSKSLPQGLWAELVSATVYILNRTGPTQTEKTPYEMWWNKKPRIRHLRIIGSDCFVHIPKVTRKKLDKKAIKGVLIGYDNDEGYRVWIKETSKLIRSRDVIFEEKTLRSSNHIEIPIEMKQSTLEKPYTEDQESQSDFESVKSDKENIESESEEFLSGRETEEIDDSKSDIISIKEIEEQGKMTLRDRSKLRQPTKLDNFVMIAERDMHENLEPETFQEALRSKDSAQWKAAMDNEIRSLKENETWEITSLPSGRKAIPCKWIYKVKTNPDGSVDRYKARLVIKGYSQKKGVDYYETFSPVAKMSTIRTVLSIAARDNMNLTQFDVSTAFLYGSLNEEIYMKQPEGYSERNSNMVCKLSKSLYGLKQAPRCWNHCMKEFLLKIGFRESEADPCLYIKRREDELLILALYVDDGLLASSNEKVAEKFLKELESRFKIKSKPASYFLGLEIEKTEDTVRVSQAAYTKRLLERFNMESCNPALTPILKESDNRHNNEFEQDVQFPYRQAVGALAYLMVGSRPDIAYAVGVVSRSLEKPTNADVAKLKRIFRYLKGTLNWCIEYKRHSEKLLITFSDADHGGDLDTARSTSGLISLYGGAAISWRSHRQASVALSSTEAEIVAASEAAREIVWLKRLIESIEDLSGLPTLCVDNEAAIKLAHNPAYEMHQRTKHIRIRHFYIRETVSESILNVSKVSTELQWADMLTKPLYKPKLSIICKSIGMRCSGLIKERRC